MRVKLDLTGMRFGKLVVDSLAYTANGNRYWNCLCDCGNSSIRSTAALNFRVKSCGCLRLEKVTEKCKVHGKCKSPIYHIWIGMRDRCHNKNSPVYKYYGGRGITVCDAWLTFTNFYADMGDKPIDKSLDRIDNALGYSKDNCRWATRVEQSMNRRSNKYVEYNGVLKTVKEWSILYNIDYKLLHNRLHKLKWPIERALGEI